MACKHCVQGRLLTGPQMRGSSDPALERLRSIICLRCGSLLPAERPADTMLEKLSQLARFGLADGATPLLEVTGGGLPVPDQVES
jgi:hypothetical protein